MMETERTFDYASVNKEIVEADDNISFRVPPHILKELVYLLGAGTEQDRAEMAREIEMAMEGRGGLVTKAEEGGEKDLFRMLELSLLSHFRLVLQKEGVGDLQQLCRTLANLIQGLPVSIKCNLEQLEKIEMLARRKIIKEH